ncbi:hypothetical protein Tco_0557421 [Tanacetum coccineum]
MDFAKPVKAIFFPQDVPSTSDSRLIELEHQVQCLMEAYIALMQPTQVNKITSSCEICSGTHDTQYCMENPEYAFVEYASSQGNVKSSTTEYKDHEMTVESEEEFEEETEEEIDEEEEDSPLHYNWIMSKRLEPRRKPSNLKKIYNFVRRVKRLKVFVGNFTYKCDFMLLEDATSVIDHHLGSVVFKKPFVEATGLVYDIEEGTIAFEKDKEKIVFKMPYKMEMFKHIDFTDIKTYRIPPYVIESDDDDSKKNPLL